MTIITITKNFGGSCAVRLRSSDDAVFRSLLDELKTQISYRQRRYDPDQKCWEIAEFSLLDGWLEFAQDLGARVKVIDEEEGPEARTDQQAPPPPPPRPGRMRPADALGVLHLLPSAPPELIKATHKTLAILHHPDKGGDVEKMKLVNAAFDVLTKGGSK